MTAWLPAAIGAIAAVYASVGHAGATGYIAVLTLVGLPADVVRPTALMLNVCVAALATAQFARAGHLRRDLAVPLVAAGVPAAFVGGAIGLHPAAFEGLVGAVLAIAAVRLAARSVPWPTSRSADVAQPREVTRPPLLLALGAVLGLLAGLTGVGGGVFLTPALLALRVAAVREVAAVSAVFILLNSIAGLGGWLAAGGTIPTPGASLVLSAVAGGAIGARLGALRLPARALEGVLAAVLAVAAAKLLLPLVTGGLYRANVTLYSVPRSFTVHVNICEEHTPPMVDKKEAPKATNKSEEIRKIARAMKEKGEKPRPVTIIALLKKQGVVVTSPQVSMVLKGMGFRPRRRRKPGKVAAGPKPAGKARRPGISVEDLVIAKKVIGQFGGAERALAAIQAVQQFEG